MISTIPHPLEKHTSKLPAILLLHNLGWQYLSPKQALAYRGGKAVNVVLREVLSQRSISYLGQERALSAKVVKIIWQCGEPCLVRLLLLLLARRC
ncbi:hypothetical protein KZ386_04245 [Glaesserella parasuis]|uniref:Uncharacterized protein n=2 Tax=Glaesserella parasuis TaxID=738 RepID=A0A836MD68_GLAPU|nr:hypothetical protein [Glaesserella parasuis]KDB47002.1 hypothetical protein HPS9_03015 [Glaesserella parasuis HPS9]MCT8547039.1 hypothetical protein [Glaesserella parasuis]MCT8551289.1 hypothetical protein [Glaesserella parasuis]MCT8592807.1 hypothetical protein [Glaesserella parasuis]MCT8847956.1 hypothetical protein [Glaesserella parasuis]